MYLIPHSFHFISARNFRCYLLHLLKHVSKLPWPFSRSISNPGIPVTSDRFLGVPLFSFSRLQVTHVNVARSHAPCLRVHLLAVCFGLLASLLVSLSVELGIVSWGVTLSSASGGSSFVPCVPLFRPFRNSWCTDRNISLTSLPA